MAWLLGAHGASTLEALAGAATLLAFDFDGTLAPLVVDRDRAKLPSRTRALLREANALYPVCVISGRGRADVRARLTGTGITHIIGNHGLEMAARTRPLPAVRQAHRLLRAALRGVPGVDLEDKGLSLAVHYRRAPDRRAALARIHAALARLPAGLRHVGGHEVENVLPPAGDKGVALKHIWDSLQTDAALYIGDDVTDEDAFALPRTRAFVAVRVGHLRSSAADWYLRGQDEVDVLLRRLIDLRLGRR